MPIVVTCRCGARFAARDDLAGQTVACPNCRSPLAIRDATTATPEPSGVASILDEIGVTASEGGTVCPICQNLLRPGKTRCQHCQYDLQTATIHTPSQTAAASSTKYNWKRFRESAAFERGSGVVDQDLSMFDIGLCILCCPLSLMYGLLMFARGNSKGLKLVLMSYMLPLIVAFIRLILEVFFFIPQGKHL